ncbi:hypothetical protein N7463_008683 [Penicillium fimorum]|uniref:Kinesin light chain n=1 Tax=Penicillium fimorum TaxID=1882269 RepID=A0A9W9XPB8_9EURO|nr:hypothetical protein N7463_008683 [Penicillium fimorum]
MANLALMFRDQGRWEEAEKLQVQVMETRKTKLGEDHPDTLTGMANLALTYTRQGRWEEAEKLQAQNQGRWEETEKLEVQVMETRKTKLGDDHPDTLASMTNLAFTWKFSDQSANALGLLLACLAKQDKALGPNHPQTLSNLEALLESETEGLNMDAQIS